MTRYINTKDTAKLVRVELKKLYPGVKFSVRCDIYAGGSAIDVRYTSDTLQQRVVNDSLSVFMGSTFDGMTDSRNYHDSVYNGETVHFAPNYVTAHNSIRIPQGNDW